MDDNDNYLEFSKMNFSPFSTQFANVNQLTKFTQNLTANGQVLGLVSSGDNGVQFLRPLDSALNTASAFQAAQTNANLAAAAQTFITLPITMPGAKPGDAQQTVQIQVLNPNPMPPQVPKFQMGQMQIPIQSFQQGTTVLTVAYSPQDGEILPNHHSINDGVTVLAAIQPQDLQLLAQQAQTGIAPQISQQNSQPEITISEEKTSNGMVNIKSEPLWTQCPVTVTTSHPHLATDLNEFLINQRASGMQQLQTYLKFNNTEAPNIKKELFEDANDSLNSEGTDFNETENDSNASIMEEVQPKHTSKTEHSMENQEDGETELDANGKPRKKRKSKKKPPKPKRPKPGQVHIATALDGTILFCCPECQMAYPEKESLEQHLVVHKIERRYICDLCGAGLKRKEHLERHKLGHNPDRPYVCPVCMKGFKRKEHLNLHAVIHSGMKTEICNECGKGFYRKDHLRKHQKSHLTKRLKEEANMAANSSFSFNRVSSDQNSENNSNQISVKNNNQNIANSNLTVEANSSKIIKPDPDGGSGNIIIYTPKTVPISMSSSVNNSDASTTTTVPLCLPQEVTIHVPTSDNTTLPVQIQVPHLLAQTTTRPDGSTNTIVIPSIPSSSS